MRAGIVVNVTPEDRRRLKATRTRCHRNEKGWPQARNRRRTVNMAVEDMIKRIDKNTSNVSILMSEYNELCIEVMTNEEKRGRYWMERGVKEFENKPRPDPQ